MPRLLIFPHYLKAEPLTTQTLSTAQTVFQLMPRIITATHSAEQGLTVAKRLARQVTAYRVTYGDAEAVADWLEQILNH